jgi:cell shape-determining protein MreC
MPRSVYPRGLEVGTVASVERSDDLFLRLRIHPSVDLAELDQAYVLELPAAPSDLKEAVPFARH